MKKAIYNLENGYFTNKGSKCRVVLVTHNDLDGAGCAVVNLFNDGSETYFCSNGKDTDDTVLKLIDEYKEDEFKYKYFHLWIADNSVSEEVAAELDRLGTNNSNFFPMIFDHHKSAESLARYDWVTIDTTECGTTLLYNYFASDMSDDYNEGVMQLLNEFCNTVKDRDLWLWENNGNKNANIYNESMRIIGIEEYVMRTANNIMSRKCIISADDEKAALDAIAEKDKYVEEHSDNYFKESVLIDNCGYQVAFTFASRYVSELGNAICSKHNDIDICAIICTNRGEYGTVELRATKDYVDLAPIAKGLGGGGHKHAAGFPLKKGFREDVVGILADMMGKLIAK